MDLEVISYCANIIYEANQETSSRAHNRRHASEFHRTYIICLLYCDKFDSSSTSNPSRTSLLVQKLSLSSVGLMFLSLILPGRKAVVNMHGCHCQNHHWAREILL